MVKKSNHHLVEVLCAFWFDPKSNPWDSTFYGKYFDKIAILGYTEKDEKRAKKVSFKIAPNDVEQVVKSEDDEANSKMIFRDSKNGTAIIMSANFVSFHKLEPYKSWEALISDQVIPAMKAYEETGIGKNVTQAQAVYINKYDVGKDEKISDIFTFVPSVSDFGIGQESNLLFQSQYDLEPNLTQQIKVNSASDKGSKEVFFECSCFAYARDGKNWKDLAKEAHDQNNKVFKAIIKD